MGISAWGKYLNKSNGSSEMDADNRIRTGSKRLIAAANSLIIGLWVSFCTLISHLSNVTSIEGLRKTRGWLRKRSLFGNCSGKSANNSIFAEDNYFIF